MKQLLLIVISIFFYTNLFAQGQIINVPDDQPNIQAAINASVDGDTVLVADGLYYENINFRGKAITVASWFLIDGDETHIDSTIINGSQPTKPDSASVVSFVSGEDTTSVLYGFTITGGSGEYTTWRNIRGAGGIGFAFSGGKIQFNKIVNNSIVHDHPVGGGIAIRYPTHPILILNNYIAYNMAWSTLYSNLAGGIIIAYDTEQYVLIAENVIANNTGFGNNQGCGGGGICVWNSNSIIRNNLIKNNKAQRGGGIDIVDNENLEFAQPIIINNTIVNNSATDFGGGIMGHYENSPEFPLKNNIVWGNTATNDTQISMGQSWGVIGDYEVPVEYSNVEGGYTGTGNINFDPLFADTINYYLTATSPCIDAGQPDGIFDDIEDAANPGFSLFPALGGLRNDMGVYGGNPYMIYEQIPSYFIRNCSLNNTYQVPGTDTLIITSEIFSPENQLVEVKSIIENYDGSISDTIPMFDDGTHKDNIAIDGFYTSYWVVPNGEDDYKIHISTYLSDYEYLVALINVANFTSKGLMAFESMEVTIGNEIPNPPERIKFSLTLRNYGITDTVYDVDVNIILPDNPLIVNSTTGIPKFGDIAPRKNLTSSSRDFAITFMEGCENSSYEFGLEITSNDVPFWYSTFTIDVVTGIDDESSTLPKKFALDQNYPNPFNPSTTIKYSIPVVETGHASSVRLIVYDVLGREVATLVNEQQKAGYYEVNWDASNNSSGIYFYKLNAGTFMETKKMILLR